MNHSEIKCVNQVIRHDSAIFEGDACELIRAIPGDSIHFGIHSPPFIGLYKFSNFDRDISNSDNEDFWRLEVAEIDCPYGFNWKFFHPVALPKCLTDTLTRTKQDA